MVSEMFAIKLLAVDKNWPVLKNMVSLGQSFHGGIIRTINNTKQNLQNQTFSLFTESSCRPTRTATPHCMKAYTV